MHEVIVVTDPEDADGFRLAGVEVRAVSSGEEARRELAGLLDDDAAGIVVMSEEYIDAIDERTRKKMDASYRPVVVFLPTAHAFGSQEGQTDHLSRLIRKAVGFDITLRRG